MRYFKVAMICVGFILAVVGITAGVLFLTGKFEKEIIQPENIAFEITDKLTEDDFDVMLTTTTENVTEKQVTLSLTNQSEVDGYITDGIITVPKTVTLGKSFTVKVNKTVYSDDGMTEEWNVGGISTIRAKSTNPLIQEATPLNVKVDVPVKSISVELVSLSGEKLGEVSTNNNAGMLKVQNAASDVVELAVGSVIGLKPKFVPAKSAYNAEGVARPVFFEIPTAWKGIHIDFYDENEDSIKILRHTTTQDIKINCYTFKTTADEVATKGKNYTKQELISIMNESGISGSSAQLFGTNQKITSFSSNTNNEYLTLDINKPVTLFANNQEIELGQYNLGLDIASDAGVAKLEDKLAFIKLYAYYKDAEGNWIDAGTKFVVEGQGLSTRLGNGVTAKINKTSAGLSTWRVVAGETGTYKLVVRLEYEYYSSTSSTPQIISFDVEYKNIVVNEAIASEVSWSDAFRGQTTLTILDGETPAERYFPRLDLSNYVEIENPNATYKVVKYFAYSTDEVNNPDLTKILNCSLYASSCDVPDSSKQYTVYEIEDGNLITKDVGSYNIFFATVLSDYLGNVVKQNGRYVMESLSKTHLINVVKSLKSIEAVLSVNSQEVEEGAEPVDFNQNTDPNTKDYYFHVRQQDENVFTLSLFVNDLEIFERDYNEGKILIKFFIGQTETDILNVADVATIFEDEKRIDFTINVGSLPNANEPDITVGVEYLVDQRLNTTAKNVLGESGQEVKIKVLNGFVQTIDFAAVKDKIPAHSQNNPIDVSVSFEAGVDNVATSIKYSVMFNGEELPIESLAEIVINKDALNKAYTLTSSHPAVISVVEKQDGTLPTLSILGSTEDVLVTLTAQAADGSGKEAKLYFRVEGSSQAQFFHDGVELTENASIEMYGFQGNSINFEDYFDVLAGDTVLDALMTYGLIVGDVQLQDSNKYQFADNTLTITSTFGRDASLQVQLTTDFGLSRVFPINIKSDVEFISLNHALNDEGLNDQDFANRGESVPTQIGTRVYAEHNHAIQFSLSQKSSGAALQVDQNEFITGQGVDVSFSSGILTLNFAPVSVPTVREITYKKLFVENDAFGFTSTMRFVVFPNVKLELADSSSNPLGDEENPVLYKNGETIIYNSNLGATDEKKGVLKLSRILGEDTINIIPTVQIKVGQSWQDLTHVGGEFMLPTDFAVKVGQSIDVRVVYQGYTTNSVTIFLDPYFDETLLPATSVKYDGVDYIPFVVSPDSPIQLSTDPSVRYSIISANPNDAQLIINENREIVRVQNKNYLQIIATEKLKVTNLNGEIELPILILPIDYPFAQYDNLPATKEEMTIAGIDLKTVLDEMFDTLDGNEETVIHLNEKITYTGDKTITIINADGTNNSYIEYDANAEDPTIKALPVGGEKIVLVEVKCGLAQEEAFTFLYRLKISATQSIETYYPYLKYEEDEEYDRNSAYEYVYFNGASQISIDLMGHINPYAPNFGVLADMYGIEYARRFVVVKGEGETKSPMSYKDLRFEIANVGIGQSYVPENLISNYAFINQYIDVETGDLIGAQLLLMPGASTETVFVTIKAYTKTGAVAYYRFRATNEPVPYQVFYKSTDITENNVYIDEYGQIQPTYTFATNGGADLDLGEAVTVKININPQSTLPLSAYGFLMRFEDGVEDYSQFVSIDEKGLITINALVNNITTTVVIYGKDGEIARFRLILKATIDHEIKTSTVGQSASYDIGENVLFFSASRAEQDYLMEEIDTNIFARSLINNSSATEQETFDNFFIRLGGYKYEDISEHYSQYVIIEDVKNYASDLFQLNQGQIIKKIFEVHTEAERQYIRFNGAAYYFTKSENAGTEIYELQLPIANIDGDKLTYKFNDISDSVEIDVLNFRAGSETRDFIVFDMVKKSDGTTYEKQRRMLDEGEELVGSYASIQIDTNWVNYPVVELETEDSSKEIVKILYINYSNSIYFAQVDSDHFDHEYIQIDDERFYFTRFYKITYDAVSEDTIDASAGSEGESVTTKSNVPSIKYELDSLVDNPDTDDVDESSVIDLSEVLFVYQNGKKFNLKDVISQDEDGNKTCWFDELQFFVDGSEEPLGSYVVNIMGKEGIAPKISIVIKDKSGNFVVGRVNIVFFSNASTSSSINNKTIIIPAGDEAVEYAINDSSIESLSQFNVVLTKLTNDNGKSFTGVIANDTKEGGYLNGEWGTGWSEYFMDYYHSKLEDDNSWTRAFEGTVDLKQLKLYDTIKVEARLKHSIINKIEISKTVPFETWWNSCVNKTSYNNFIKGVLKGTYTYEVIPGYLSIDILSGLDTPKQIVADLKAQGFMPKATHYNNGNKTETTLVVDETTWAISGVPYGTNSTIEVQIVKLCEKCGTEILAGDTDEHTCMYQVDSIQVSVQKDEHGNVQKHQFTYAEWSDETTLLENYELKEYNLETLKFVNKDDASDFIQATVTGGSFNSEGGLAVNGENAIVVFTKQHTTTGECEISINATQPEGADATTFMGIFKAVGYAFTEKVDDTTVKMYANDNLSTDNYVVMTISGGTFDENANVVDNAGTLSAVLYYTLADKKIANSTTAGMGNLSYEEFAEKLNSAWENGIFDLSFDKLKEIVDSTHIESTKENAINIFDLLNSDGSWGNGEHIAIEVDLFHPIIIYSKPVATQYIHIANKEFDDTVHYYGNVENIKIFDEATNTRKDVDKKDTYAVEKIEGQFFTSCSYATGTSGEITQYILPLSTEKKVNIDAIYNEYLAYKPVDAENKTEEEKAYEASVKYQIGKYIESLNKEMPRSRYFSSTVTLIPGAGASNKEIIQTVKIYSNGTHVGNLNLYLSDFTSFETGENGDVLTHNTTGLNKWTEVSTTTTEEFENNTTTISGLEFASGKDDEGNVLSSTTGSLTVSVADNKLSLMFANDESVTNNRKYVILGEVYMVTKVEESVVLQKYFVDTLNTSNSEFATFEASENKLIIDKDSYPIYLIGGREYIIKDGKLCQIVNDEVKEVESYIIKDAVMDNNEYVMPDGTKITINGTTLTLSKWSLDVSNVKFEFAQNLSLKVPEGYKTTTLSEGNLDTFYQGIDARYITPTAFEVESKSQIYKAEKTIGLEGTEVVFKDYISGKDFNFDQWTYNAYYKTEEGSKESQNFAPTGEEGERDLEIALSKDRIVYEDGVQYLYVDVTGITTQKEGGTEIQGAYSFRIPLSIAPAVNVEGGLGVSDIKNPIQGLFIASGQEEQIVVGSTDADANAIFTVTAPTKLIDVTDDAPAVEEGEGEEGEGEEEGIEGLSEGEEEQTPTPATPDDYLAKVYYLNNHNYLPYLKAEMAGEKFLYFEAVNNGTGYDVFAHFRGDTGEVVYKLISDGVTLPTLATEVGEEVADGEEPEECDIKISYNTDLYDFVLKTETTGEDGAETTKTFVAVTPKYTFEYSIVSNSQAVTVKSFSEGILTLTGAAVREATEVKFKFEVVRGDKIVATAYYLLTVNPNIHVEIHYPTVKASTNDDINTQTYERININDYTSTAFNLFDVSPFDVKNTPRVKVFQTYYGQANDGTLAKFEFVVGETTGIVYEFNKETKEWKQEETGKTLDDLSSYYKFKEVDPEIKYEAMCSVADLISGIGEKFTFKDKETNGDVDITFTVKSGDMLFAQYFVIAQSTPVVRVNKDIDPTHMEGDVEIIPINGGTEQKAIFANDARIQFVYNNIVLNSSYYDSETDIIKIKYEDESSSVSGYTVLDNAIVGTLDEPVVVKFMFKGSEVGEYKYRTVWNVKYQYEKLNSDLTGELNKDGEMIYLIDAGKDYYIAKHFGITGYFDNEYIKLDDAKVKTGYSKYIDISIVDDKHRLNVKGAANGGTYVEIEVTPYEGADVETIRLRILPAISFEIESNFENPSTYPGMDGQFANYTYASLFEQTGVNAKIYIVQAGVGQLIKILDNNVLTDTGLLDLQYTFSANNLNPTDASQLKLTKEANNVYIEIDKALLPELNRKYIKIQVMDDYGYTDFINIMISARNQVSVADDLDGTRKFKTGETITWNSSRPFPLLFQNNDASIGAEYQLTSLYEYGGNLFADATTEEKEGQTPNIKDNIPGTSLRAEGGKLYGVQLDSFITYEEAYNDASLYDTKDITGVAFGKLPTVQIKLDRNGVDAKNNSVYEIPTSYEVIENPNDETFALYITSNNATNNPILATSKVEGGTTVYHIAKTKYCIDNSGYIKRYNGTYDYNGIKFDVYNKDGSPKENASGLEVTYEKSYKPYSDYIDCLNYKEVIGNFDWGEKYDRFVVTEKLYYVKDGVRTDVPEGVTGAKAGVKSTINENEELIFNAYVENDGDAGEWLPVVAELGSSNMTTLTINTFYDIDKYGKLWSSVYNTGERHLVPGIGNNYLINGNWYRVEKVVNEKGEKTGYELYMVKEAKTMDYIPYDDTSISFSTYRAIALAQKETVYEFSNYDLAKSYIEYMVLDEGDGKQSISEWHRLRLNQKNDKDNDADSTIHQIVNEKTGAIEIPSGHNGKNVIINIGLVKKGDDAEKAVEIQFTAFKVTNNGNLYYAERQNPTDCYTFEYSYEIDKNQAISDGGYAFKQADELNFGGRSYVISDLDITVNKKNEGEEKPVKVDTIPVSTKLVFATYPTISQDYYYAGYAYDEVGDNDSIKDVLENKKDADKFNLIHNDKVVEGADLKYSTVLGQEGFDELPGEFTRKLTPIYTLTSNPVTIDNVEHTYDETNRTLTLSRTLTQDVSSTATYTGTATINNIQYTFERTTIDDVATDTLTIGYQKYTLEGSQIEIDGIVYAVDYGSKTLSITSKLNGMLSCDINNKTYTVDDINEKLKIKTNYETIYLTYNYGGCKYWGQWNYKVVDKWTNVKVSYGQEGAAVSYLTFSDNVYTYDPNTQTITNGTTTYVVRDVTDSDGKREYQVCRKLESGALEQVGKLVRSDESIKIDFFDDGYEYGPDNKTITNGTKTYDVKVEDQVWTQGTSPQQVGRLVRSNESIKIDFFDDKNYVTLSEQNDSDTAWAKVVKLVDHSEKDHSLQDAIAGGLITIGVTSAGAKLDGVEVEAFGDSLLNKTITVKITYISTYSYDENAIEFEADDDIYITTESAQKTKTLQYAGEDIKVIFKSILENIPEQEASSAS